MESKSLNSFTWTQVVSVTTISVTVVACLWPVFASAAQDLYSRQAANNARKAGLAMQAYAADWDGVIPRHDNNGSCLYAENPCNPPDWGDLRPPGNDIERVEEGKAVMFFGALRPYMQAPTAWNDPAMGRINWNTVSNNRSVLGITMINGPYSLSYDEFYHSALGQAAANYLLVGNSSTGATNNRPGAVRGRLSLVVRPEETIAAVMESAWDWDLSAQLAVGNGLVWPSYPNPACWSASSDGWTRYALPLNGDSIHNYRGNGMAYYGNNPAKINKNPNIRGNAMFLFVDMHVAPMRYKEAERCDALPSGQVWRVTSSTSVTTYYPHWVPEL